MRQREFRRIRKSALESGKRKRNGRKVGVSAAKADIADDPTTANECEAD
jgi:hypothetical protein